MWHAVRLIVLVGQTLADSCLRLGELWRKRPELLEQGWATFLFSDGHTALSNVSTGRRSGSWIETLKI